ncbi:MAG: SurA N-terminal domain-containing protein [Oligoflexia bacterium]|nr:SurA N-terminal domain-containing protein [Oligoflexia bacterium]
MVAPSHQRKTASIIASVFIGFIILSFMFSGYYDKSAYMGPETVANVGGVSVKMFEYKNALTYRVEMMKQILRVPDLSTQQMEQFKIRDSVIEELVNQKLLIVLADKMGVVPTDQEVANEIQNQPYFKTDGVFDISRYKLLLQQNGFTPTDYEVNIKENLKEKMVYSALSSVPISSKYVEERLKMKNNTVKVSAIQIKKDSLQKFIEVPESKIKSFLTDANNLKRLEAYFQTRKEELNQEDAVEARHILVRFSKDKKEDVAKKEIEEIAKTVNAKNFAKIADQKSEDPFGKGKGGYLGRFGKGKMMPEFEKVAFELKPGTVSAPVKTNYGYHLILVDKKIEAKEAKLADPEIKNLLVKELIQKESKDDLKKLTDNLSNDLKGALVGGKVANIQEMQKKYEFTYEDGKNISELDEDVGAINLSSENLAKVFAVKNAQSDSFVFTDANFIKIVYVLNIGKPQIVANANANEIIKEKEGEQKIASDELKVGIMKYLRDNVKITIHKKLL